MDTKEYVCRIAVALGFGIPTTPAEQVSGGLMHKMYRLNTAKGAYAVKLLNPAIMRRPDAHANYALAERLETVLQARGLPVVPALEFHGKKMQQLDGQYFYVFDWSTGAALSPENITPAHCAVIGKLLAQIHNIERADAPSETTALNIPFDEYIALATAQDADIAGLLADNRDLLYALQDAGNRAWKRIPAKRSICNGDMDSKNVLWENAAPKIIDLECLQYGNPYTELFQLALGWAGGWHDRVDYERLRAFIQAYHNAGGALPTDWAALYDSNTGMLEWLAYNVKRALGIECTDEAERQLGVAQVKGTMQQLLYYNGLRDDLLKELVNLFL